MSGGVDAGLMTSSVLHELQVAHHQVRVLIAVSLLTSASHNLELVELHDLVIIVLQGEDRAVHVSVGADNNPVLAANSESRVHFINQRIFYYKINHHPNSYHFKLKGFWGFGVLGFWV